MLIISGGAKAFTSLDQSLQMKHKLGYVASGLN
jgi:hypothetical protein